jgi:hypothetical protein
MKGQTRPGQDAWALQLALTREMHRWTDSPPIFSYRSVKYPDKLEYPHEQFDA